LDAHRRAGKYLAGFPKAAQRSPAYPLERVLYGWDFLQRQKRGLKVGKTKRGKGSKLMVLVDGRGTPLGVHLDSASPAEVKLAETTLETVRVGHTGPGRPRTRPERVISDRAYDSDPLRGRFDKRGIELIVPHRSNRKKPATQDGRSLRRYKRRWIVERTNAWLQNFRRLVVRYERSAAIFLGLVHMACALIALKRVSG
jgi:transposase